MQPLVAAAEDMNTVGFLCILGSDARSSITSSSFSMQESLVATSREQSTTVDGETCRRSLQYSERVFG